MLFDLQGKRRRVVQVTYLTLAVLMGGGLVLFGIGGDVSGGLFDAFSERGGSGGNGNDAVEKRIERNEKRVQSDAARARPRARSWCATTTSWPSRRPRQDSTGFPDDARDELRRRPPTGRPTSSSEPKQVDASLANVALQIYDPTALNRPKEAQEAARVIAETRNDTNAYLNLVQYAALAGDTRTADLAGQKAVDLAPKSQRKDVEAQVKQLKTAQNAQGAGGNGTRAVALGGSAVQFGPAGERPTSDRSRVNFQIQDEEIDEQTHVIELGGEIDLYTAPEFKERMVELIEAGKKQIVVDLSEATFIDSTTLGVLVGGVKRLRPAGGSLALVCTDQNITKIFEITGLDRVFPIHGIARRPSARSTRPLSSL